MGGPRGDNDFLPHGIRGAFGILGAMPIMQSRILREKERRRGARRGKEREGEWEGERARASTRQIKGINKEISYLSLFKNSYSKLHSEVL